MVSIDFHGLVVGAWFGEGPGIKKLQVAYLRGRDLVSYGVYKHLIHPWIYSNNVVQLKEKPRAKSQYLDRL